ncbi:Dicer-like protein 1 [Coemansia sp. IMI 209127]|nr:Dicer-like protein 1 [Coemansia sp. IMI 209127]
MADTVRIVPDGEEHDYETHSNASVAGNVDTGGGSQHDKNGEDQTPLAALTSGIQPRDYQLSLLKRALSDNTVVILETGSGKTLVAVMLIQWFAQRGARLATQRGDSDANNDDGKSKQPGKVRVFLNNTVALVHQQARVIAENTDQKVQEFIGSMGIDEWDDLKWADKWNNATVFVMTHQVLLNALRAGHIHISDIDLLVFDECHHARGHHPYALIMREFYDHCPADSRPHIFGMTASPLNARQTAEVSVMHLQSVLDSNICTVDLTAHTDDALVSKQTSVCYEYKLPPEYEATELTRALAEKCGASKIVADGLRVVSVILPLLGPFGVDQMWHYKIIQWYRKMMHRPARSMRLSTNSYNALSKLIDVDSEDLTADITNEDPDHSSTTISVTDDPLRDALLLKYAIEIDHLHGARAFGHAAFNPTDNMAPILSGDKPQPIPHLHSPEADRKPWDTVRSKLSPQVNRLLDVLYQWRGHPDELRGIVFAHRRLTAVLLVYIISRITEFSFITADVLLGVSQRSSSGVDRPIRVGSTRAANNLTLADFAKGRINLLFATQVAEEGVDIQPCNLVIRFDMPQTATSLIQSRGRARMANSLFIVMVPEVDVSQKEMMSNDSMVTADAELQSGDKMLVDEHKEYAADPGIISIDEPGREKYPKVLLPEHRTSYTDYLKLMSLEECLREWCRVESLAANEQPDDGIIVTDRSRIEYGMLLRRLRESLVLDDSPDTELEEIWVEHKDKAGRIYTIMSTQARISYLSALNIVHRYVQLLPQDASFKLAPIFEFESETHLEEQKVDETEPVEDPFEDKTTVDGASADPSQPAQVKKKRRKAPKPIKVVVYRCITTLPANAAIRQVAGPLMPNKKLAKQASAYRTAKKLHQLGAIDDNLNPVIEVPEDSNTTHGRGRNGDLDGGRGKPQGTRSSVSKYECAALCYFVPPPLTLEWIGVATPAIDEQETAEEGLVEDEPVYFPRPWYLYRFSLQEASSTDASWLVLATAQPLPNDTLVPLYTAQYAKGLAEPDLSATFIGMDYIGSQVLDQAQVDTLASFSSKLMVRLIFAEMAWSTAEIGAVLAPMLPGGSGIDFEFAKSCFRERSGVFRLCNGNYTQYVGQVVMDGLDSGRLKLIEGVCDDVDIYSNLAQYHASKKGAIKADVQQEALSEQPISSTLASQLTLAPASQNESSSSLLALDSALPDADTPPPSAFCASPTQDTDVAGAEHPEQRKRCKKGVSLRASTRTMSEWALVKRIGRLVPKDEEMGRKVPLFKVKDVALTNNYLVAPLVHSALDDQTTLLTTENSADSENATQPHPYPDVIYSSPFFCAGEPLNIDELNNLSLLPAFLLRLEHVLLAQTIKEDLGLPAKTETIRHAITASSSGMDVCYERLETLGDSVLKYITSIALYITYPDDHEGLLTSRRSAIVGNHNLCNLSLERRLEGFIIANVFAKKEFRLPGKGWERFTSINNRCICTRAFDIEDSKVPSHVPNPQGIVESEQMKPEDGAAPWNSTPKPRPKRQTRKISTARLLSEKTIADIVESLLGACVIDGGLEGALKGARALGIVRNTWTSWSRFASVWEETIATRKASMRQLDILCSKAITSADKTEEIRDMLEELYLDRKDVLCGTSMLTDDVVLTEMASRQYQKQDVGTAKHSWASDIEAILGYTFKDRSILIEALTHCSSIDLLSNSYQRLEYLGDAIIDYFVTRRYYDYKPVLNPHRITLVKHIAVCNNLFAVILVCHGLHKYIRHDSGILAESIKDYIQRLTHARNTWAKSQQTSRNRSVQRMFDHETESQDTATTDAYGEESGEELDAFQFSCTRSRLPVWTGESESRPAKCRKVDDGFTNSQRSDDNDDDDIFRNLPPECWNLVEPPKVLGDVFESLIGAIYVDSGMDNDVAKGFYDRFLSPFLDRFVDSGQLSLHPVVQSLLICQGWGCGMLTWKCRSNPDQMEFINKYICDVKIHDHIVMTAMGESARHAKFNASSAFLQLVGATAPNTLYGDMRTANLMPEQASRDKEADGVSKLDRLLKPICTCFEQRRAEAKTAAALESEAEVVEKAATSADTEPYELEEGELASMDVDVDV